MNGCIGKCLSIFFLFFFATVAFADRVAIIGGGAAGLVSAWLIENNHDVTLFEKKDHLGGQAQTLTLNVNNQPVKVETGVDFFNEASYPKFIKLLHYLNIPIKKFTLTSTFYRTNGKDVLILPPFHDGEIEWKSLSPCNWDRFLQLQMVLVRGALIISQNDFSTTLQESLVPLILTKGFRKNLLYPLISAGWGVRQFEILDFSAYNTLKYLTDSITVLFQWETVPDGLITYINAVAQSLQNTTLKLKTDVKQIKKEGNQFVILTDDKQYSGFDQVIIATEPTVTAKLLRDLPQDQPEVLEAIEKIKPIHSLLAIHSDPRFMPPDPRDWRISNVRYDGANSELSIYKSWVSITPIFKSWLNIDVRPKSDAYPSPLYALIPYEHSIIDRSYFEAQKVVKAMQGKNKIWFAGLWTTGRDIHENAIVSAINIAHYLSPESERLKVFN